MAEGPISMTDLPPERPSAEQSISRPSRTPSNSDPPIADTANQAGDMSSSGTTVSDTTVSFKGWDSYPRNIVDYDVMEYNIDQYHGQFNRELVGERGELGRLVGNTTRVTALTVPHSGAAPSPDNNHIQTEYKGVSEVEALLQSRAVNSTSLFITISPNFSFGRLLICREALLKLLTHYTVLPGFIDVLCTFGVKSWEKAENFSIYRQYISRQPSARGPGCSVISFELCYNLKYVERRLQYNTGLTKFTTRKMGIWTKYYPEEDRNVWILVNPPTDFPRRLSALCQSDKSQGDIRHHLDIHRLQLSCANENWNGYINDLEEEFEDLRLSTSSSFRSHHPRAEGENDIRDVRDSSPTKEHAQTLQFLRDKLLQLSNFLNMNLHTIESMEEGIKKLQSQGVLESAHAEDAAFERFTASVDDAVKRTRQHRERVLGLTRRCDSLAALVPSMLASLDNSVMLDMQEQAARYTRSMRIVTVVAMFFLPPTLVAGFFGTELIKGTQLASYESGMKWFWVCVAVLMVITFGLWLLYQHFDNDRRRGRRQPDIEARRARVGPAR